MNYYRTDPETGELVSPDPIPARPDPRTPGEWFLPRGVVLVAPPAVPSGHAARWTGEAWELPEDHRGRTGWVDGLPTTVGELGPLPDGWSDEAPPTVPAAAVVTPRQIRLALLSLGVTPEMVEALLHSNPAAMIEWEYASFIERAHPLVSSLGTALGFEESQIDAIFADAATR